MRANDGSRSGGEILVDQLIAHGVQHVFCVPGESYLAALDAFHDRNVTVTVCRQEGGAAMMAEAVGTAGLPSTRREQDTAALVLTVDDVDATYARLRTRGVEFTGPPANQDAWGIRAAHFRDPDGNLLEVCSPLKK